METKLISPCRHLCLCGHLEAENPSPIYTSETQRGVRISSNVWEVGLRSFWSGEYLNPQVCVVLQITSNDPSCRTKRNGVGLNRRSNALEESGLPVQTEERDSVTCRDEHVVAPRGTFPSQVRS